MSRANYNAWAKRNPGRADIQNHLRNSMERQELRKQGIDPDYRPPPKEKTEIEITAKFESHCGACFGIINKGEKCWFHLKRKTTIHVGGDCIPGGA